MYLYTKNDYGFSIAFEINDVNGNITNLVGGVVTFKMSNVETGVLKISGNCVIDDATLGLCHYDFVEGDLDAAGEYRFEVEIDFSSKIITAKGKELIVVSEEL